MADKQGKGLIPIQDDRSLTRQFGIVNPAAGSGISAARSERGWLSNITPRRNYDGLNQIIDGLQGFIPSLRNSAAAENARLDAELRAQAQADARIASGKYRTVTELNRATQNGEVPVQDNPIYKEAFWSTYGIQSGIENANILEDQYIREKDLPGFDIDRFITEQQEHLSNTLKGTSGFFQNSFTHNISASLLKIKQLHADEVQKETTDAVVNTHYNSAYNRFMKMSNEVVTDEKTGKKTQLTSQQVLSDIIQRGAIQGVPYDENVGLAVSAYIDSIKHQASDDKYTKDIDYSIFDMEITDTALLKLLNEYEEGATVISKATKAGKPITIADLFSSTGRDNFYKLEQDIIIAEANKFDRIKRKADAEAIKFSSELRSNFELNLNKSLTKVKESVAGTLSGDANINSQQLNTNIQHQIESLKQQRELLDSKQYKGLLNGDKKAIELNLSNKIVDLTVKLSDATKSAKKRDLSRILLKGTKAQALKFAENIDNVDLQLSMYNEIRKHYGGHQDMKEYQDLLKGASTVKTPKDLDAVNKRIRESTQSHQDQESLSKMALDSLFDEQLSKKKAEGKTKEVKDDLTSKISGVYRDFVKGSVPIFKEIEKNMLGMSTENVSDNREKLFENQIRLSFFNNISDQIKNDLITTRADIIKEAKKWQSLGKAVGEYINIKSEKGSKLSNVITTEGDIILPMVETSFGLLPADLDTYTNHSDEIIATNDFKKFVSIYDSRLQSVFDDAMVTATAKPFVPGGFSEYKYNTSILPNIRFKTKADAVAASNVYKSYSTLNRRRRKAAKDLFDKAGIKPDEYRYFKITSKMRESDDTFDSK